MPRWITLEDGVAKHLVRDANPARNPFGADRQKVELVVRKGPWVLYRNLFPGKH